MPLAQPARASVRAGALRPEASPPGDVFQWRCFVAHLPQRSRPEGGGNASAREVRSSHLPRTGGCRGHDRPELPSREDVLSVLWSWRLCAFALRVVALPCASRPGPRPFEPNAGSAVCGITPIAGTAADARTDSQAGCTMRRAHLASEPRVGRRLRFTRRGPHGLGKYWLGGLAHGKGPSCMPLQPPPLPGPVPARMPVLTFSALMVKGVGDGAVLVFIGWPLPFTHA